MNWYSIGLEEALSYLESNKASGLEQAEADKRIETYGFNRLESKKGKSLIRKFIEQLSDFMILILLAAAVISFSISLINGEADYVDPILILAIVILNAVMGIVQESKAEQAIESLQKLSEPKSTVIRDGKRVIIDSEAVVPGDIIIYEAGNRITADARLLECHGLRVEESSLTGESLPVDKLANSIAAEDAPIGERTNMVYSGSVVVAGHCTALVTATGMKTEVGKIAGLIVSAETPETPLQKRLDNTGKVLGISALITCGFVFILGIRQQTNILDSFMLAVSLAVAAVPEGLPAIVTIVLAVGVQRMAQKNAIVRKLPAVETLGSATVICSDKTGTLTQNKMMVQELVSANGDSAEDKARAKLLTYAALCTNLPEAAYDSGGEVTVGDPTESAIVTVAQKYGISKQALEKSLPRVYEIPFESSRKLMTTVHKLPEHGNLVITKGAPDVLINLCKSVDVDGIRPMTENAKSAILQTNAAMAGRALRVIGVAYRQTDALPRSRKSNELESGMIFLGLIGMIDPPRPEAREAVLMCRRAGIRTVMITGDHAATASAIAKELGILTSGKLVATGQELDAMNDEILRRTISKYAVFARVSPEHKSRIVRALQANGEIVAMTGDGVNDAPALKIADIGCAMGKIGTDVARDAADMVLTDDNFSTIVSAVREGRSIYENICRTVHFLLSCNVGEILTILVSFLMGRQSPLLPIQLLWINLVTDSLPALAIGAEKAGDSIMGQKPTDPHKGMFSGGRALDIIVQGVMIGTLALIAYQFGFRSGGHDTGRTYTFAVLSLSQLVHAFNTRSDESLFSSGFFTNREMNLAFVVCCVMQVTVICVPGLAGIFGSVPLTLSQWRTVALLSLVPLVAVEAGKIISSRDGNEAITVKI